jgi:hypothetical protein
VHVVPQPQADSPKASPGIAASGNGQFYSPIGIAVDAAGNVWVGDIVNYSVQKFNSSGSYLSQFGSYGTGNGQFLGDTGIAIDGSGNVFVEDYDGGRVEKFNSSGSYLAKYTGGSGGNKLRRRGARNDDEVHPSQGSRRSGQPLLLGWSTPRAYPSANPDAYDSDDSSP